MKRFITFKHFRFDLFGGITAGIVALPLALAFGQQSGLGAAAGLYGAAFIAFFAALFGGTPTQISGPTAPMTALSMVVVAGIVQVFEGKLEEALPVILGVFFLAGMIQIVMGWLKLGTYIKYIPHTVVSGFMSGIGVIILITQLLPALGYYSSQDEEVISSFLPHAEELMLDRILKDEAENGILVLEDFKETIARSHEVQADEIRIEAITLAQNESKGVLGSLKFLPRAIRDINWIELAIALITILIIYGFKRITTKVPSTLVALLVVTVGAYFAGVDYRQITPIETGMPPFRLDIIMGFDLAAFSPYIVSAFLLAMLGAIDSLLTSVVADNMTRTQHDPNQELVGQGIGNGVAAFFGGLPGAGATIRTVVNIQSGGKTKLSGMVAGLLLFVIMLVLGPVASQIPAACLAGILITVGFGVMDYKGLRALRKMETSEKVILITVLLLTVFWQLVYAVGVGLVMASVVFLKRMGDISSDKLHLADLGTIMTKTDRWNDEIHLSKEIKEKVMIKHLSGPLFFGMTSDFNSLVADIGDIHLLVIRMRKVPFIDQSGLHALEVAIQEMHRREIVVVITGASGQVLEMMKEMEIIPKIIGGQYIFEEFGDALRWINKMLNDEGALKKEIDHVSSK